MLNNLRPSKHLAAHKLTLKPFKTCTLLPDGGPPAQASQYVQSIWHVRFGHSSSFELIIMTVHQMRGACFM